jgi:glycerol-3-phosphate acyltransferase PlsY
MAIWALAVLPTKFASLGSLVASLSSPLVVWLVTRDGVASAFCAVAALLILWKHRENVARLLAGNENKIGLGRSAG